MSYRKCPRCEINYIKEDEELCAVCNPPVRVQPVRQPYIKPQAPVKASNFTGLPFLKLEIKPKQAAVTSDGGTDKKIDLEGTEQRVMAGLKDFQCATVERVAKLYKDGIRRVLVADEVGLGKTLVARGVIAKEALRAYNAGKKLFNVVYVCSNSGIASQNIEKLRVSADASVDRGETRLSMQHLIIAEKESAAKEKGTFIRLIPVTPATSFQMSSGRGTVQERALMYAVLKRLPELADLTAKMEEFLICYANKAWEGWARNCTEWRVTECEKKTGGSYLHDLLKKIKKEMTKSKLLQDLIDELNSEKWTKQNWIIQRLRTMFATVSVESLKADLVIMDEFQRFKSLLSYEQGTEAEMICRKMFGSNTQILLLSATPYKLYSTLEEIEESNTDEHYSEFMKVLNFLFDDSAEKMGEFSTVWSGYTAAIKEFKNERAAVLSVKDTAETALFSHIARTERGGENDVIDDSAVQPVEIMPDDISTYIEMTRAFESAELKQRIYEDYIKSCPYPLSFMRDYKLKKNFETACGKVDGIVGKLRKHSRLLWLDDKAIRQYERIAVPNARFTELEKRVFSQNAHNLLWVPPSKPYYGLRGAYEGVELFSKTLVFSAWEMVPRMISTLLSYECERRVRPGIVIDDENGYFGKADKSGKRKRQPGPLLTYKVKEGKPQSMSLFTLMYPSKFLADIYNPIDCLNRGITDADEIAAELKEKIAEELSVFKRLETDEGRVDQAWYYLAPMLIDIKNNAEHMTDWLVDILYGNAEAENDEEEEIDEDSTDSADKMKRAHIEELRKLFDDTTESLSSLGKMPDDLIDVLADSALGSFAVCAMRVFKHPTYAFKIAEMLRKRFNLQEATAIVANNAPKGEVHWRSVLRYCINGGIQAMLDEYYHVLYDAVGKSGDVIESVYKRMAESFALHTSSPRIDTFGQFKAKMTSGSERSQVALRTHFAVNFSKDADDQKHIDRKNSLRNAFNSPMWPFALSTTSIGQEGLDFHNYCRRIVHWNLPSNPIDLEQREGRINRYKCLAVRQSIAEQFGEREFAESAWDEMFAVAAKHKPEQTSDLFPFWRLGEMQTVKIERIVPQFPLSKDILKYDRLIKILSLYRLSLGQPRQEEFIESIIKDKINKEELEKLFINLSPFYHQKETERQ